MAAQKGLLKQVALSGTLDALSLDALRFYLPLIV